jgi:transposase
MRGLGPALLMPAKDPKRHALRQQGVLNPRPGDVIDLRFAENSFFDPRDLVQVKYEMLRRVQAEGYSITQAAAAFGFSRPSFYQTQAAFAQEGLAGLVPRKRGPKQAHKLTEEVLGFIHETQQQGLRVRTGDLVRLIQQRFGTTVHPRSITRALSRHQKKLH